MDILLDHVIPRPLQGIYAAGSIWDTQFKLVEGQYYLVSAASGKGKSTLLSYLYGIRNDFTGHITFHGRDIGRISLAEWSGIRKTGMAMMFQDLKLFGHLTAMENILLKSQLTHTVSKQEIMSMCGMLGVDSLADKPVKLLSMGQQQRIALIRTLVQPFSWLLLDEPFSHLDTGNISKAGQLIDEVCRKNGAGLILTTLGESYGLHYHSTLSV